MPLCLRVRVVRSIPIFFFGYPRVIWYQVAIQRIKRLLHIFFVDHFIEF